MKRLTIPIALAALFCLALGGTAVAQDAGAAVAQEADALAKAAQNPLASLVTLPLQANYNLGIGPLRPHLLQPQRAAGRADCRARSGTSSPAPSSPSTACPPGETDSTFGVGDTTLQPLLLAGEGQQLHLGRGPGLRPAHRVEPRDPGLRQVGAGTVGGRLLPDRQVDHGRGGQQHLVGGRRRRPRRLQPVRRSSGSSTTTSAAAGRWGACRSSPPTGRPTSGQRWTIPWGLQVSKVTRIGAQPVNLLARLLLELRRTPTGAPTARSGSSSTSCSRQTK